MEGSKNGPSHRVQVLQVQARRQKPEEQRQQRSDTIRNGQSGGEGDAPGMGQAEEALGESLACLHTAPLIAGM